MRRLAFAVLTACGFALLTACGSSGGSGFSSTNGNGSIDSIAFTNGSGQVNDFFVTGLGGTAPLQINAIGQKGSGPLAVVVPDAVFTWAGRFVDPTVDTASVASYSVGPAPGTTKPCPKLPVGGTPAIVVYQQSPSTFSGLYPGFAALPAAQAAATVYVGAVAGVTPPYCLVILATHVGDGALGSKTVLVTNGTP